MSKLQRFGISIPEDLIKKFDHLITKKGYSNRSEAIRDLIRDNLVEQVITEDKEIVGTITIVYNHETRELADLLTDLQHHYFKNIVTSSHVHLDEHNCLEVLIVKGKSKKVKEIAEKLISTKGVKHGKLTMTTTGKELI